LTPAISIVLDDKKMQRALTRISHEILERNSGAKSLVLIGILTRGAVLAKRIAKIIKELEKVEVPVGFMDISLYRDDVHSKLEQPIVQRTDILFEVRDKNVVLIDDVLYTGRTVRAALDQMVDFGRARTIQLAVLIDRGHRELPIKADYVGANVPTSNEDRVVVKVTEHEGKDEVLIERGNPESRSKKPQTKKTKGKK
jgi:pyrimidine operon attenuation protein/uracil phosphoribosyltransferase